MPPLVPSNHPLLLPFMMHRPPRSTLFPYTTLFPISLIVAMLGRPCAFLTTSSGSNPCSRARSEEHTSELQSHHDLVCRLLLEKKNVADGTFGSVCLRSFLHVFYL